MTKNFRETASTFLKNVGLHAQRVAKRDETPGEAWAELQRDVQKVKKSLERSTLTAEQKESNELMDMGRHAYNVKDYAKAEAFFRQSLFADKSNCLAQTYLGHTFYKQGRIVEAKQAWERAAEIAPTIQAGEKARQKLMMLQKKKDATVEMLQERMRKEP